MQHFFKQPHCHLNCYGRHVALCLFMTFMFGRLSALCDTVNVSHPILASFPDASFLLHHFL
jgi:hypothetical protein